MRKYMPIFMAVIIGIIFGNLIFDSYEAEEVMASYGNVYMLQYGAYTDKSVMYENIKTLDKNIYITVFENSVYYVYLGITTNYDNALELKKIYDEKGIFLYIKDNYLGNSHVVNKIKKLDRLIKVENDEGVILNYVKEGLVLYMENN